MRQQSVSAIEDVRNGVKLMLPQGDFRVCACQPQVPSVVLPGTGAVEHAVISSDQVLPALRFPPKPVPESILNRLLFLLG